MSKRITKMWIIYICVTLLILCCFIGISSMLGVSAEVAMGEQTQVSEDGMQSKVVSPFGTGDSSEENNKIYVNLGSARLSEGDQGLTQIHYIENANYFFSNPQHRENKEDTGDHLFGTCTTVAHQILLGYHNYYSDRRLIPEQSADGTYYLPSDYGNLNADPILSYRPSFNDNGRSSIGTTDEVFFEIFNRAGGSALLSQTIGIVANASDDFLEACINGRTKNWTIKESNYNKQEVVAELDSGRPVILGFKVSGGHTSHVVVAYGYAYYDGNFCYITHYGYDRTQVQMLVPESWLGYQVTMTVDHAHTYELIMGETYTSLEGIVYNAMECTVCGCKTLVDIATLFAGGTGTVTDPFLISNAEQFANMGMAYTLVNVSGSGQEMENRITYAFKLTNSITLPGDWDPFAYKFAGDFDGNGYYISYSMNLSQADINESNYQGLFGFVVGGGKIYDLELINCSITSDVNTVMSASGSFVNIGFLAGSMYEAGIISNVTVTNSKIECRISNACIGALAGTIFSTSVTNCVVRKQGDDNVPRPSITNNTRGYLGGMAGMGDIDRFSGGSITIDLTNTEFIEGNDMMGKVVGDSPDTVPSDMIANVTMDKGDKCIVAGTLITLADGSRVPVEQLTGNEMLLVWNMQTGQFDSAPILFIDSDPAMTYRVIQLSFSDGSTVEVIYEHGFWDCDLNQYVYLDENAAQYIGHWFNKQIVTDEGTLTTYAVQLTGVSITNKITTAYSPVTYGHLCYYVNGMLSMPGGIEGLFNIFEVDAETMKYDEAQTQADIAQYGLFTYEEFAELFPVSEEVFEAFNGQYLKVAMGKGLIDAEGLQTLIERYAEFLTEIE